MVETEMERREKKRQRSNIFHCMNKGLKVHREKTWVMSRERDIHVANIRQRREYAMSQDRREREIEIETGRDR